jgi:hypothetical protein
MSRPKTADGKYKVHVDGKYQELTADELLDIADKQLGAFIDALYPPGIIVNLDDAVQRIKALVALETDNNGTTTQQ